ncbi:MAG: hydrolase [Parcubacteria group bacterium Gr01-1014_30]|nr:MAG: hydrolase [Parcubacteria group bacterium Gr01-1014_30]
MKDILILHGWGSSAKNWGKIKEMLEIEGLKVFLPDLPGFGQSPPLEETWAVEDYANWVKKYCKENNLSPKGEAGEEAKPQRPQFFLMGHSFGGSIALKYSLMFPGDVKKLLLVAPAIIRVNDWKKEFMAKMAKAFNKFPFLPFHSEIRRAFYRFFVKSDYPGTKGPMRETYLKVVKQDFSNQLSSVSVPTVLIWGDKDNVTPFKFAHFVKAKIPGAELKVLEGIGHIPREEAPELFVRTILESVL